MDIRNTILKLLVNSIPIISAIYVAVGIKLLKKTEENRISYFSFLMFACAIYSFGYFLELNCVSLETLLLVRNFEILGTVFVPSFGVLFVAELTKIKIPKITKGVLLTVSILLWVLFITNPLHKLIYKSIDFKIIGGFSVIETKRGFVYYFLLTFVIIFLLFSIIALIRAFKMAKGYKKENSLIFIFITFQIPWLTILFVLFGFDKYIDPAPATILLMCGLFLINELKNDMFELQIISWKRTFLNIGEPAFLVDKDGELVYSNSIANVLFIDLNRSVKSIIKSIYESELAHKTVSFTINNQVKWFEVKKNNFYNKNKFTNYLLFDVTERNQSERKILESERILTKSQKAAHIGSYENDIINSTWKCTEECDRILGIDETHIHTLDCWINIVHPDWQTKLFDYVSTVYSNKERFDYVYKIVRVNDGAERYVHEIGELEFDENNNAIRMIGTIQDITEQKLAQLKLLESEELFRSVIEFSEGAFYKKNLTTDKYVYLSPVFEKLTGYMANEYMNMSKEEINDKYHPDDRANIVKFFTQFDKNNNFKSLEYRMLCKDGEYRWFLNKFTILQDIQTQDIYMYGATHDINEQKKYEEEILNLSYNDQLTGLHNRRFYEQELERLAKEQCAPLTLVMIDVNGLKLTNDAFGHKAGDVLLEKVASVLKRECRTIDIVSRIGGDEFVLLLPETDLINADKIINRINEAIAKEKMDNIVLSVSIGFAVKQDRSDNINDIFKEAEDDMYRHKLSESSSMRSKTIDLIMNTLYEKNNREMLHSKRVSEICEAIAIQMNLDKNEINQIRIAGLMHDIGKIGIDEKILNKPKKLSDDEWNEIERHSEIGYRILCSVKEFSEISKYVLEHHERFNGKGYPRGLKGEEISLQARIIAIADTFDAMTSDRSYKKASSEEDAILEIKRCMGTHFDPDIARIFIEKVLGKVESIV